ncbi:C40 family peptidase [Cellulosimicrobium sp. 72-3]|uniref:C40 family peptidase n=1 Tax=Cellulosimicrobium sp. 72-3 TaxID=2731680 RepID=UPI00148EA275|nr:C40 family peptidase [Cellulosimicrobium sp. 72-3]
MTQALARVGEIRTEIVALHDVVTAPGRSTPASSSTSATDFASALSALAALPTTGAAGTGSDVVGRLLGTLSGATGADELARSALFGAGASPGSAAGAAVVPAAPAAPAGPATAPDGAPDGATDGVAGRSVVETARQYLGVPYVWGGESLGEGGLDCSGLVQLVYSAHGVDLPRVARDQMRQGTEVGSLAEARPGDLVVQRGGKHIGIYVGDGQMIHAPKPGRTVEITDVTDASVTTVRRVIG